MGLPAKCMHFVGSPGWRGNSNSPRDEQLIRSVPEHDEDFDGAPRITNKRLPFGRKRKRKRQGEFSEFPPAPQNSSYPHGREARISETNAPLSKGGQRVAVSKRKSEINKQAVNTMREAGTGRSYAIKADGKECRPLFVNFNLTSLSRARKF